MAAEGLKTLKSAFSAKETADRLAAAAAARGLQIFARIDHAGGAAAAGLDLRPTELLIFGAARGGTPMLQAAQTAGIDLPLRALVWQDAAGAVWLSYNDPAWIAVRHGAPAATAAGLVKVLEAVAAEATG
jgi:uncharacterized protein (DUF302 family)